MKLDQRTYVCPECGMTMDRDVNAAINIRNFALRNVIKNGSVTKKCAKEIFDKNVNTFCNPIWIWGVLWYNTSN